ncbi:MAG: hypothetical protein IIA87_04180 [Nanoarchaeota archaeon]|nr:hypothetical protein [Nanoarchaeota archaeon]
MPKLNTMKIKDTKNFQFLGAPRIFDSCGFQAQENFGNWKFSVQRIHFYRNSPAFILQEKEYE